MLRHIVCLFLALTAFSTSWAQDTGDAPKEKTGPLDNTVFIQVEQTTLSLSYERRFIHTSKFFLVGRIGAMAEIESAAEVALGYIAEVGLVMGRKRNFIESGLKYYKLMPEDPQGLNRDKGFQGAFLGYRLVLPRKYGVSFRIGISIGEAFEHNEQEVRHEYAHNQMYLGIGYRF
jgi:hypothetical protein